MKQNLKLKGNIDVYWVEGNLSYEEAKEKAKKGEYLKKEKVKNLVVYDGIEAMFQRMAQEYAGNLYINKAALGTGEDAVDVEDTSLQTETYRNDVASMTASRNILYVDAFFSAIEVDGTFKEFGFVIDGVGAGTGTLWNRVNVNWVKSNTESMYVSGKWTLTNET